MVSDVLVDGPDEIGRFRVWNVETEFPLRVGLRVANFLHPGRELDENYGVARRRLAAGAVGDRSAEGGCAGECDGSSHECGHEQRAAGSRMVGDQTLPFWRSGGSPGDSIRSISVRIPAASSSSDCFMLA